eukprot:COSAG02_NODE_2605_length_8442_cov_9.552080_6_plen_643_part_00
MGRTVDEQPAQCEPGYWAAASGLFDGEPEPEPEPELEPEPERQPEPEPEPQKGGSEREAALAIEAAWKGMLSKPQFRRQMAAARPRPAPAPSGQAVDAHAPPHPGAESLTPSTVGSATATEASSRRTGDLREELSSLAACTGVASPPPAWPGWGHERQQLSLTSPAFVVLSYIFPEDMVQVVYISGAEERVAWSVPWNSVRAKRSMTGAVSLLRKPDGAHMVGVDKSQWAALQSVRERAKASEREHLAAKLHCDASMMMYPQRSLVLDNSSTVTAAGQYWSPLHLPVAMKRSSPSLITSLMRKVNSTVCTAGQSLQSMREGSLPLWYFSAMRTGSADQNETAIAALKKMADACDESSLMALGVPSEHFAPRETCVGARSEKPLLLPVASEWVARSPTIAATPPNSGSARTTFSKCQLPSPGRGRVGGGFQRPSSQPAATRSNAHRALNKHAHIIGNQSTTPAGADPEELFATAKAVGGSEGFARRRAMATLASTRPATTTGSARARLARSAVSSHFARSETSSSCVRKSSVASPRSHAKGASPRRPALRLCASARISESVHVSSPMAAARARQVQLIARRRAAEMQLASLEAASNQQHPSNIRPAKTVAGKSFGGQENKSRPVSRVDSPATAGGFLYSAFNR